MNPGASTTSLLTAAVSNPQSSAAVPEESKGLSHHLKDGKGFVNPWPSYREMSGWAIGRAMIWRKLTGKSNSPDTAPPTVPIRRPSFLSSRQTSTLRATWLGHACYYVEFPGGFRVLFDPVFTPRCSPFSFLGPKRYTEVPCQIDEIPTIDAVIISHNHYDHLSYPTIKKIEEKHPNVQFFAPLGNKKWFTDQGFKNVTEMDWWESKDIRLSKNKQNRSNGSNGAVVTEPNDRSSSGDEPGISANIGCLPCQHTSARTPFDKGQTLWASWSVESGGKKVWFGGDTGYRAVSELPSNVNDYDPQFKFPHCPAFKQIGDLRGPFDLGLIPIGAYLPRHIMSPMHANPFDSVNIFIDTKCKRALGIHWGTWVLTEEDVLEPPKLLKEALKWKNLPETGVFDVCDIGESREIKEEGTQ